MRISVSHSFLISGYKNATGCWVFVHGTTRFGIKKGSSHENPLRRFFSQEFCTEEKLQSKWNEDDAVRCPCTSDTFFLSVFRTAHLYLTQRLDGDEDSFPSGTSFCLTFLVHFQGPSYFFNCIWWRLDFRDYENKTWIGTYVSSCRKSLVNRLLCAMHWKTIIIIWRAFELNYLVEYFQTNN